MRGSVLTTASVDYIDHNSSSKATKEYCHGTAISKFKHPFFTGEGVNRTLVIAVRLEKESDKKIVINLPYDFTKHSN